MSDNKSWQSPDGSTPPPPIYPGAGTPPGAGATPPGPPPVSPPPAPQAPAPMPSPYGAPAGWTPPPKPGLIPLQPMTLGTILAGSFQVIRRNPRPTFGISLLINGIMAVISLAVVGSVAFFAFDRVNSASSENLNDVLAGSTGLTIVSALVTAAIGLIGGAILQGIISLEVARATVGEKLRLGGLWALAKGRIGILIGWTLLATVVVVVGLSIITGVVVLLISLGGDSGLVIGVIVAIFAFFAVVALVIWLGTKLSLVPSILLLERLPLFTAIRRSWSLTTGYFWRTFGIQILVAAIVGIATQIITVPVSIIMGIITAVTNPNADPEVIGGTFYITLAVSTILAALIGSITTIISTATTSLIYLDLRMRKEGLDLTLTRFVEARQSGDTSVPDPYLSTATPTAAGGTTGTSGTSGPGAPSNESPWV